MGIHNLEKVFHPGSVAVFGAADRPGSVGGAVCANLVAGGFPGAVFPIHPAGGTVSGLAAHTSLAEVPGAVDLAVVATPIETVPEIVSLCAERGVRGCIVISSGGRETGPRGEALEAEIRSRIAGTGLRVIGPNCLGVCSTHSRLNATFAAGMPAAGKLAFVSQSGAINTALLDASLREHMGFSHFVSLGSMLDVDFADAIDYVGSDPRVGSILMYVESIPRVRAFMSAARAVSRLKPIIALKAGRTRAGARAAASHTGAMAGRDAVYDAAFERAGIVRVDTFEALFDCAEYLAKQPKPAGPGLAVVTNAGGPGVMAVDALSGYGFEPAIFSEETLRRLDEVLPPHWSRGNPVDMLGQADPDTYLRVARILVAAREVDGLLLMMAPQALVDGASVARAVAGLERPAVSVITSWLGGASMDEARRILNRAGLPTFDSPERAVRAFVNGLRHSRSVELLQEIPPKLHRRITFDREAARRRIDGALAADRVSLTETEAKAVVEAYGIPVNPTLPAESADEAVALADAMGYPVVLKVAMEEVLHKSDAGGVLLRLCDAGAVREGFDRIRERFGTVHGPPPPVSVQPMVEPVDHELILGVHFEPRFGPVVAFGLGGIATEVFQDRGLGLPPLNRLLARRIMEKTRVLTLLSGYRHLPPVDLERLEEMLVRISQLAVDFPAVDALDINPLVVSGDRILALDARILLRRPDRPSPAHLVVSPYPDAWCESVDIPQVGRLTVRPIRPEDAPLLTALFETLSPRSVYLRFFSPLKRLPHHMLARFTQIDYDREMALVAVQDPEGGEEKMLGVARVIPEPGGRTAEFAVLVGDPWQGKGIGANLLRRVIDIARDRGVEKIYGIVLSENTQMLALGKRLGFRLRRVPDTSDYELTLTCTTPLPADGPGTPGTVPAS